MTSPSELGLRIKIFKAECRMKNAEIYPQAHAFLQFVRGDVIRPKQSVKEK
jgi:hypothetical protein